MKRGEDLVRRNLADCTAFTIYKGWIPKRFVDIADRRFSFVHIDVDLHEPTIESMRFFYDRMSEHGIIICDDYGSTLCPGATRAVHEFFEDKPERMIALPSFGGFIIKGVRTSTTGGIATA